MPIFTRLIIHTFFSFFFCLERKKTQKNQKN